MSEKDEALRRSIEQCLQVLHPKKGSWPGEPAFRELKQHCENYLRQHAEIERLTAERDAWVRLYRRAINEANGLTNYVEDRPELRNAERKLCVIEQDARLAQIKEQP